MTVTNGLHGWTLNQIMDRVGMIGKKRLFFSPSAFDDCQCGIPVDRFLRRWISWETAM
jgi:hypothetical protein